MKGEFTMDNRRILAIVLFVAAIAVLLVMGLAQDNWGTGVLVALACIVVGIIFFRRGD
jgi:hypothetical protein